jgi:hypothetical protein
MTKKEDADLATFWQTDVPGDSSTSFHSRCEQKILAVLKEASLLAESMRRFHIALQKGGREQKEQIVPEQTVKGQTGSHRLSQYV